MLACIFAIMGFAVCLTEGIRGAERSAFAEAGRAMTRHAQRSRGPVGRDLDAPGQSLRHRPAGADDFSCSASIVILLLFCGRCCRGSSP
jgi:hypothetical protein